MSDQNQIAVLEQKIKSLPDLAKKKISWIKWGVGLSALIVLGPLLLGGLVTGIGALLLGGLAFALVQFAPLFVSRVINARTEAQIKEANRHLAALKAEAERNPIETLQNEQRKKHDELAAELNSIRNFETEVLNLKDVVAEEGSVSSRAKQRGEETLAAMNRKLEYRKRCFKLAQQALAEYDQKVKEAEALWRVSLAAHRADEASGSSGTDIMRRIMEDTAFKAVDTSVNSALAGLRASQLKDSVTEDDLLMLDNNPTPSVLTQTISNGQSIYVTK